jgi:ATP-dependent Clp protease protease subunit
VLALIAEDTGQDVSTVEHDSRRDRWFTATEALDYGFVDHIAAIGDDILPGAFRPVGLGVSR